ncbi:hypothetical protein AB7160_18130 [Morganella morganii]|uniref:ECs1072 family phage-associated protein n=1 Tax=Morganella morganii TaxID=582 RepID=UPI0034E5FF8A
MSKYTQLLQYIQEAVYPAYGEKYSRFVIRPTPGEHRAKIHCVLIFLLEVIIYEHRKKYAQPFAPIHGIKALRHKIFTDKLATIHEIESISFECIVFVLLKDLHPDNFHDQVRSVLESESPRV